MRKKKGWIAVVIALALPGMAETAGAQSTGGDTARACQCQQGVVSSLNDEVQAQSHAYAEKRRALEALGKEVETARPKVDVLNRADIDAFKQLLDRRDAAAAELTPANASYADAVKRYNDAVADYNDNCTGSQPAGAERRPLVCPKP